MNERFEVRAVDFVFYYCCLNVYKTSIWCWKNVLQWKLRDEVQNVSRLLHLLKIGFFPSLSGSLIYFVSFCICLSPLFLCLCQSVSLFRYLSLSLSLSVSVPLFLCPCLSLSFDISLCLCLSLCICPCFSVSLSFAICLCLSLSLYLSLYLSVPLFLCVYLSLYLLLSLSLSIYLSLYLSVSLFLYLSLMHACTQQHTYFRFPENDCQLYKDSSLTLVILLTCSIVKCFLNQYRKETLAKCTWKIGFAVKTYYQTVRKKNDWMKPLLNVSYKIFLTKQGRNHWSSLHHWYI